jgi:hypothetical protein
MTITTEQPLHLQHYFNNHPYLATFGAAGLASESGGMVLEHRHRPP